MATRALIAIPSYDDTTWLATYCHWDGHPEYLGNNLLNIIRRDGYTRATYTLFENPAGWSTITPNNQPPTTSNQINVPGYGHAYPHDDNPAHTLIPGPDIYYSQNHNPFIEYIYYLNPHHMLILNTGTGQLDCQNYDDPTIPALTGTNQEVTA
jgi:hypothetical protein